MRMCCLCLRREDEGGEMIGYSWINYLKYQIHVLDLLTFPIGCSDGSTEISGSNSRASSAKSLFRSKEI